jgi:AAA family ATP:ADP antiporter
MPSPFKAIMDVKREELPLALLMLLYFFFVITSFWILKPIKKALFLIFYQESGFDLFGLWHGTASQAMQIAKVLNMVVAFAAVAVFTWLARRFRRQQLTIIFSIFFMACYIIYSRLIASPGSVTVWTFYLFGDLYTTLMVATFFAFLNDSVTPDMAKRLYGVIVSGGVIGGAFGTMILTVWIDRIPISWWLWVTFGLAAIIIALAVGAGRIVERRFSATVTPLPREDSPKKETSRSGGNPAIEGARLVFASRYLLAIVAIVGLYEFASNLLDFQFNATIEELVERARIARTVVTISTITNVMAMIVQLFVTSFIMTRLGVRTALLILPGAILLASAGFLAMPVLLTGSLLSIVDNGFNYSINQSAKETLYVPTTRDEKYKAKAFIDMFVQRFAKTVAVAVTLVVTTVFSDFSSIRWLSLFALAIAVLWIYAVRFAGRRFDEMTT